MALKFYRQRDIDEMDVSNIPDDFKSYFDTLSDERKKEIYDARPELCEKLGYKIEVTSEEIIDLEQEETEQEELEIEKISKADYLAGIKNNYYQNTDIKNALVQNMKYLELLTIPDGTDKCIIHRCEFINKQIKFVSEKDGLFSMVVKICPKCNRAYLEQKKVAFNEKKLASRNIKHKIYDLDLTMEYLRSVQPVYVLQDDEKIYVPDVWIEEKPMCPIHNCKLFELKCVKKHKDREIKFKAYYCEQCKKLVSRNAAISDLVDTCAQNGIPIIKTETLEIKKPVKQPVTKKDVHIDYYVEDGKRFEYNLNKNIECYKLDEEDTIVVSDSNYCNIDGHENDTNEVLVVIKVKEKKYGIKSYLLRAGYCSICQKYYIEELDYKVIYGKGRPMVMVITDLYDDNYNITSGEVYNLEKDHLNNLEGKIESKINSIKNSKDYVNRYKVNELHYDDGGLNFAKNMSIMKYEQPLKELNGYKNIPYTYRVDLKSEKNNLTYYVGADDISLENGIDVISFNDEFGQELVNYKTTKVTVDGTEYSIKLSRQFDIDNATLYGYSNLKTDEDLIFQKGITDEFLVRVLKIRKKQHNLVDIIATIQENQNRIVEAPYQNNIIVQGCAGSGKTMVLLHRLSSLKFKNKGFDFERASLILTPNDNLSLQIKSVAEGLQIGSVERKSIEDYYKEMLVQYSNELKPDSNIVSEMRVDQDFVNYVYSDSFRDNIAKAFDNVINKRNEELALINKLTTLMGYSGASINFDDNAIVVDRINMYIRRAEEDIYSQKNRIKRIEENMSTLLSKKKDAEIELEKAKTEAEGIVRERIPGMYSIMGRYVAERDGRINDRYKDLEAAKDKYYKVNNSIFVIRKKTQLNKISDEIELIEKECKELEEIKTKENKILEYNLLENTDDKVLKWMEKVVEIIPDMSREINTCNSKKEYVPKCEGNIKFYSDEYEKAQKEYAKAVEIKNSDETESLIKGLKEITSKYSVVDTYKAVFEAAVKEFKASAKKEIKIIGNYHRYDLYAELLFAMKYFNKVNGDKNFICVDEGQDLSVNEYKLIAELNHNNVVYNIYGDTNQLMKSGRGISDWNQLDNMFKSDMYVLNENYRNTNQITRFCNTSFDMDVKRTGVDGVKVREIPRKELENDINKLHIGNDKVAVLIPRSYRKNIFIKNEYLQYPDIIKLDKIDGGNVSVLYVDEAKGVEFKTVYVVGSKMNRNEKYIAYTRALSELVVVVDN